MKKYLSSLLLVSSGMLAGCCGGQCCQSCCGKPGCCSTSKQKVSHKPTIQNASNKISIEQKNTSKTSDTPNEQKTNVASPDDQKAQEIKQLVKDAYAKVVESGGVCSCTGGCCGGGQDLSQYLGYSDEELKAVEGANLGLGCGHPISLGDINAGQTVLDLGSGAGIDCLLAAKKVGPTGKVIGVDMTESMITKARENAKKYTTTNVEFRLGDIEQLPIDSESVDIIISNCVINLAPDKQKVFSEAYRVLKTGGKMYVSDVILLKDLTAEQRNDPQLLCACIAGALLKNDYIAKLKTAGFTINVVDEDTAICQKWFGHNNLPIASLKFVATKQ